MPISPKLTLEAAAANMADIAPPYTPHEAIIEANRCLFCFDAPCIQACPTGIDIPSFIKKLTTGNLTGSAKVNINDGSYQVSAGVGIDSGKLTPGFPGKIKEKLELTYDSKCGWGIKGTVGAEAGGASASIEGCVFLTQGP